MIGGGGRTLPATGSPALLTVMSIGPRPTLGAGDEAGGYGVGLNVPDAGQKFFFGANPVVKVLPLPEGAARLAEETVGVYGGGRFEPAIDGRERFVRFEDQMHVVGHNGPAKSV